MTTGQILFYGGSVGVALFGLLTIVMWIVYEKKKKKLLQDIEQEYR